MLKLIFLFAAWVVVLLLIVAMAATIALITAHLGWGTLASTLASLAVGAGAAVVSYVLLEELERRFK